MADKVTVESTIAALEGLLEAQSGFANTTAEVVTRLLADVADLQRRVLELERRAR